MTEFKSWDELSELEQLQSMYSDASKDAYGFRVRNATTEQWNSIDWLRAAIDNFSEIIARENALDAKREKAAIAKFEDLLSELIDLGADDRETAIRWLLAGEDDMDYFCYHHDLPYDYFKELA
jgi:hypothetical protein